jgi:16S rRNA processing protein RimM
MEEAELLFVEIDEIEVPFFITPKSFRKKSSTTATILLDDIETTDHAEELVGHKIYLPETFRPEPDEEDLSSLTGFKVIDHKHGEIGIMDELLDFKANPVLRVLQGETEILIPVHEDIVKSIDVRRRTIRIKAPEGLIDLYL